MNKEDLVNLLKEEANKAVAIIRLEEASRNEVGKVSDFLRSAYEVQFNYIRHHDTAGITFYLTQKMPHLKEIFSNEYPDGEWSHHDGCDLFILK